MVHTSMLSLTNLVDFREFQLLEISAYSICHVFLELVIGRNVVTVETLK